MSGKHYKPRRGDHVKQILNRLARSSDDDRFGFAADLPAPVAPPLPRRPSIAGPAATSVPMAAALSPARRLFRLLRPPAASSISPVSSAPSRREAAALAAGR